MMTMMIVVAWFDDCQSYWTLVEKKNERNLLKQSKKSMVSILQRVNDDLKSMNHAVRHW